MRIVYLACVGNRDLKLFDGQQEVDISPNEVRSEAERLLDEYHKHQHRFRYPILSKAFDYIQQRVEKLDHVYLFVTDQPDSVKLEHRRKDTVFVGKILERLLKSRYKLDVTLRIIEGNPANYDQMYEYFAEALAEFDKKDFYYFSNSGGTPSANTGLLLQAVQIFGANCQPLSIPELESVTPMKLGKTQLHEKVFALACELLDRFEYEGTLAALHREGVSIPEGIFHFLNHCQSRLNFDLDNAVKEFEKFQKAATGEDRVFYHDILERLQKMLQGDRVELIRELLDNAEVKLHSREYVDFLGRIFRLSEELLKMSISKIFQNDMISIDVYSKNSDQPFTEWIEKNPTIKDHFLKTKSDYNKGINRRTLLTLLELKIREKDYGKKFGRINSLIVWLETLADLRNQSIMAHGFDGVSRNQIEQKLGCSLLEEGTIKIRNHVFSCLNQKIAENVFSKLNQHLRSLLKDELL